MNQKVVDEPGTLRRRLRKTSPTLYDCLKKSWKTALEWWLYAVPVELGSSNSAPHLRNVERHLDEVIAAFENAPDTRYTDRLTPAEIYVLLSAVLFHDIGKTQKKGKKAHGELAMEFLLKKHADLGVPSTELAAALGRICAFHNPPEGKTHTDLLGSVHTTSIEPYGRVREPFIASLLVLADCMDASYTRALPPFLVNQGDIPAVGRFRRRIRGVYVDPVAGMVRTVLTSLPRDEGKAPPDSSDMELYIAGLNGDYRAIWEACSKGGFDALQKRLGKTRPDRTLRSELGDLLAKVRPAQLNADLRQLCRYWQESLPDGFFPNTLLGAYSATETETTINHLLALGMIRVLVLKDDRGPAPCAFPFPRRADVAIAVGDMLSNCMRLGQIKEVLAAEGLIIKSWVLEHEEHLYNAKNKPTYEPILTPDFLDRVLGGMWNLSASVFGTSRFSFFDLAAYIGEPNVARVECAVRRIAIISRESIDAGSSAWEWCVRNQAESPDILKCKFAGPSTLSTRIKELQSPNAGFTWGMARSRDHLSKQRRRSA